MEQELKKVFDQKFLTATTFAMEIEKIVQREEGMNYIDAIVYFCEMNNIEVDSVSKIISKPLKEKIKCDALKLNFMKKTSRARLPVD
jgi:predicted AAA+ superfamily ATPase